MTLIRGDGKAGYFSVELVLYLDLDFGYYFLFFDVFQLELLNFHNFLGFLNIYAASKETFAVGSRLNAQQGLGERREDLLYGIVVEDVDFGLFLREKEKIRLDTNATGRVY